MSIQIQRNGTWQEVPKEEFLELVRDGAIEPDTEVIVNNQKVVAARIRGLVFPSQVAVPPPIHTAHSTSTYAEASVMYPVVPRPDYSLYGSNGSPQQVSRSTFILLAIFMGFLGVHNFYARRPFSGLWNIALTAMIPLYCVLALYFFKTELGIDLIMSPDNMPANKLQVVRLVAFSPCVGVAIIPLVSIIFDIVSCKTDGRDIPMKE